jgi:lipopolysaccharide transport system ATP-binding protein
MSAICPRFGIWGLSDIESYGDLLYPRVAEQELLRRMPGAVAHRYAPYGYLRSVRLESGRPADPLGAWTEEGVRQIANDVACVLVGGGAIGHGRDELLISLYGAEAHEVLDRRPTRFFIEALGPELERERPVVWHAVAVPFDLTPDEARRMKVALERRAYVAVSGETSRRRLAEAGVETDIEVVPDSAFLLPRLFPSDQLRRRVDNLRELGWYPRNGEALIVQGHGELIPRIPELAESIQVLLDSRDELVPVLVGTEPCFGDHEFAAALSDVLPVSVYHLPEGVLLEDLVAAQWGAKGVIATSLHANITAFCFDIPQVAVNVLGTSALDDFAQQSEGSASVIQDASDLSRAFAEATEQRNRGAVLRKLQEQVDVHFDRIVSLAAEAVGSRSLEIRAHQDDLGDLRRAYEVRGRRMVEERFATLEVLANARAREHELREQVEELDDLRNRLTEMEARARDLDVRARALEEQLKAVHRSRSFRYTALLRKFGQGLRRLARAKEPE